MKPQGNPAQLALALLAFTVTFYGWALLGPLGPKIQEDLDLSDVQLSVAVAVKASSASASCAGLPCGFMGARRSAGGTGCTAARGTAAGCSACGRAG